MTSGESGYPGDQIGQPQQPPPLPHEPYVPRQSINFAGLVVAAAGAVLVVLAFTALHWFRNGKQGSFFEGASDDTSYNQISDGFDSLKHELAGLNDGKFVDDLHFGVGPTYFGWLGWVLLIVAAACAVAALMPSPVSGLFRILGPIVAAVSIGLTFWAVYILRATGELKARLGSEAPGYGDFLSHAGLGFWFAVVGFLLIGIGSALGPSRSRG